MLRKPGLLFKFSRLLIILMRVISVDGAFTLSSSSIFAKEEENFTLTCIASVVPKAVYWNRNGIPVATMYMQSNTCHSNAVNERNLYQNYEYNCTDNKTYNLIINGTRISQENGSKWKCNNINGNDKSGLYVLKVASLPTSGPVVTGYNGNILYPGNRVKLICTVQGGAPLAVLSWTCNGSSIAKTNSSTTVTAISEITVNINSSYNGQTCVCKAEHILWTTGKTAESIQFVVYYPPSANLVVDGYNGSKLYVNNTIVLTCQVSGGNPVATLSWLCNGQYNTGLNRSLVDTAINILTIKMEPRLNGKSCICRGHHQVPGYNKTVESEPFLVYYASSKSPEITDYISGEPLYKGRKQLTCKVSEGFPPAILIMRCKNIILNGTNQSTSTESKYTYNITIDKTYNNQQCVCNGRNPDPSISYDRNTTVLLNVYFAPDTSPTIHGYANNHVIFEPENITLICTVTGGNPLVTISWQCRGETIYGTNQSVDGKARSQITLDIDRNYTEKQCICKAVHPDNYTKHTSITFIVYYPPSEPVVHNLTSFPWIERGNASLLCSSSPGNPESSYMWKANGNLTTDDTSQINFTNLTREFNMKNYSCKVFNNYTLQKNWQLWSSNTQLNVEYSPVISVGISPAYVVESKNFTRQCTAAGNPIPSIKWIDSDQKSADLQFLGVNRNQTGYYTCEATAKSSVYGELTSKKNLSVVVRYPPIVKVILSSPLEGQTTNILCTAKGVPDKYHYTRWTQKYGDMVIRTGNFGLLSSDKSNLTLTNVTYQDIGVYICKAHNNIMDKYDVLEQEGNNYLDIKFSPVFMPNKKNKIYAELGHKLKLEIPFFSNPSLDNSSIKITKLDTCVEFGDNELNIEMHKTSFNLTFHGKSVKVNGQKAVFVINSFQEHHTGFYIINFTSIEDLSSSFRVEVIPSGPPGQPINFTIVGNTTTSLTVTWIGDFNGGYIQTFVILFRPANSNENPKRANIIEIEQQRHYNYTLNDLDSDTEYSLWIYSFNAKGNSTKKYDATEPLRSKTKPKKEDDGNSIGVIIGAISAVVIFSVLSIAVGIFLFRRKAAKGKDRSLINNNSNSGSVNSTANEDGMRDNVLYEPAGPNYVNPRKKQTELGATGGLDRQNINEVRKQKDAANLSDVYAVVQKKPRKTKELHAIPSSAEVKQSKKYGTGNVYENMETSFDNQETTTENVRSLSAIKGRIQKTDMSHKPRKPVMKKRNKDGLIYADLLLQEPTMDGDQFVIHGIEDKTDYVEVDFSRKAELLPSETNVISHAEDVKENNGN